MSSMLLNKPSAGIPTAAQTKSQWIYRKQVAAMLGITEQGVKDLSDQGLIGRREIPGALVRYCRADVEAIIERFTTKAKADAGAGAGV